MAVAVAAQTGDGLAQAKHLFNTPGGLAHAAFSAAHVPVYALSPITEFFHKVVALALALMLTFGTYAAVDPSYARFAADSVQENVNAALDSYHAATGGGLEEFANRAQTQVAAVAENPGAALASVQAAITESIPNVFASFARALNSRVNDAVYAIAFPFDLISSRGIAAQNENGSVAVSVEPYTNATTSGIRVVASTQRPRGSPTTIVNNPIVERVVETTRLLSAGGITEELLDKKLAELDNKLSSRALVSSAANTTNITNIYASAASVARIEHLDGLDLTNPTIRSARSLSVTGATQLTSLSASGDVSLGTTTVNGDLTVTGAVNFSGSPFSALNATFNNATTTNATSTNFFATNAVFGTSTSYNASIAPYFTATSTTATSTFAGSFSIGTSQFFVDHTTGRIGVGTTSPASIFDIYGTDALRLPVGTTAQRPGQNGIGQVRYNTTMHQFEGYGDNGVWQGLGGVIDADQDTYITADTNNADEDYLRLFTAGVERVTISPLGRIGVSSSSPFAQFGIHAQNGATTTVLFNVSSSTASATSSLLSVLNTGQLVLGGSSAHSSALLQLDSTTQGFLSPRVTTVQKNAIASPAAGLLLFDSSLNKLNVYNGTAWKNVGSTEIGGEVTSGTQGSVLFIGDGTVLGQDNANFSFSTSTNRLLLTQASSTRLSVFGTAYFGGTATTTINSSGDLLVMGSTTLQNFTGLNATTTNATSTSLFATTFQATNATSTNLFATVASSTNLYSNVASIGTFTGGTGTFSSTFGVTGASTFTGLASFSNASTSLFSVFNTAYFGGTATTTINSSGDLLVMGSTTLQNFTGLNATTTNATSTSLFATTASSTNLFSTNGNISALTAGTLSLTTALPVSSGGTGQTSFGQGWLSSNGTTISASTSPTVNYLVATSTSATSTFAGGFSIGSNYLNVLQNGRIGIGTAAPTVGFDVGVATKISGDLTISGGSALTISATGPVNQTGTGQVTFAGNVDATNGLDVTNANFTVGGSNFTVAHGTGNTTIAGTLGLAGAFNASSTLQATGAARLYSTLQTDGALTAAGAGTGLSVTNNASIGGTLALTGAGTFASTLSISGTLSAATSTFLGDVALSGKKITGLATPAADTDAANKTYVDSVAQGLSLKDSVRAGTTANITLSGEQTIDGVSLVVGDRVLVKDQTDQTKNGIYVVASGVWSRSADANENSEVSSGMFTFITDGTLNASSGWVLTTTGAVTLGVSLLTFTQFSGAGQIIAGTGIAKSGNTLDVVGTANRITANADSIDIASTYVGQTSITTVGALTTGSLGVGFGNINIGASSITGGVATFSSIVGSAINGTGDLSISGSGTFSTGLTVVGTLTAATTTFSGDVALGGKKITGLADPTSAQEAATKAYVDAIAQGLSVKASVRVATTSSITLSGAQTIDGVSAIAGDRVLVMGQSTASANGIYVVAAGAWSRSTDANENSEVVSGMYAFVTEGTAYANTGWSLITPNTITLDTTALTFTQFSGSAETTAGNGLTKSGNTINAVGTTDRISVTSDAIDISSSYAGQNSLVTVGALSSGSIGSGFGSINIGSSALTAGTSIFSTATSYGTLSIGGTATTSIVGNSATSTFSGGITLAGGNVNLATGGGFLINNVLALNATTLGSSVVGSSLTSVGGLDSGSITTGFGAINIGADTLDAGATTLASLTVSGNTTLANATTTNLFSTTASSTNLFSTNGNIGVLTAGTLNLTTLSAGNGTFSGTLGVTGLSSFTQASTTRLSVFDKAYFGGTATSTFDSTGALTLVNPLTYGGVTLSNAVTGTGNMVLSTSPTLVTPALGTPSALVGTNITGTGASFTAGAATVLATARNINGVSFNGSADITITAASSTLLANNNTWTGLNVFGNASTTQFSISGSSWLGTPLALVLANATGLPLTSGVTGDLPFANLAQVSANSVLGNITGSTGDAASIATSSLFTWTGTGDVVRATSPTLVTPTLGVASATSINKLTITTPATGSTLTILDGKTLTANNSLTLAGTDATTITFQGTDTYIGRATTDTFTNKTFNTAGTGNVFQINGTGITAVTGTGDVVLSASPTLTGTLTAAAANFSGNVGIGTTTPWAKLSVAGAAGGTTPLFSISSSTAAFATTTVFHIDSNGNVGIGTSTPAGKFSVTGSGTGTGILAKFFNSAFTAVMSVLDNGTAYFLGNVGIGTTTPTRKLSVSDTVASAQVAFAYDDTRYAELRVDSTGDLNMAASGGDFYLNNDNLWVCTGGSITTAGCPSGTPTGVGNIIAENKIGIGTTTPAYKLSIETQDATTNFFQIASSTAQNLLVVNANGRVGIGTSTPFARLAIGAGGAITTVENALTDGATIAVSWLDGNQQKVTLGGNRTINFTNYIAGQILRLVVCQDGTGSRTVTWDSAVLWQGGTAPTLTTTANKCDLATFVATGATSTLKIFGAAALAF